MRAVRQAVFSSGIKTGKLRTMKKLHQSGCGVIYLLVLTDTDRKLGEEKRHQGAF